MSSHGDEYNYWGIRNMFWGRKPEEIRFKPGDIVEVMGYPGNHYWGDNCVNLAIIVKTPPTVNEVAAMRKQYLATHSGVIDHAPTISVFNPIKDVSSRRRQALQKMFDEYNPSKKH